MAKLPLHVMAERDASAIYWYRIDTMQYSSLNRPAMLVSRAGTGFQVYADNQWVFGRRFDLMPFSYSWNTPMLVPLPREVLQNSRHIRIGLFALVGNHVTLEPLYVGEYEDLTQLHRMRSLIQNNLSFAITVGALLLALFSFFLWLASHNEKQHLFGMLAAISLIFSSFNYWVLHPPFSQYLWQALAHVPLDWFCVFSVQWMATVKSNQNRFVQYVWLWGVFCTAVNLLLPFEYTVPTVEALHVVSMGLYLYALAMPHRGKIDSVEKRLIIFVSVSGSVLCTFDLLLQFGWISPVGMPRFLPLAFFMVLLFIQIIWFRRFRQTYRDAQRSNATLTQLVNAKEIELGNQFSQLARLQAEKARTSERQQIYREIHDGMGGHLLSAMALSQRESPNSAILTALRSAHDDMRLLVEGGSISDANLGEALGQLRYRLEPQINAAGLILVWQVPAVTNLPNLDFQQHMHVVRLVQECVTNVIKHAKATTVTVSLRVDKNELDITVSDDGAAEVPNRVGNGFRNSQYRATQLGGEFSFTPDHSGSVAKLRLVSRLTTAGSWELAALSA